MGYSTCRKVFSDDETILGEDSSGDASSRSPMDYSDLRFVLTLQQQYRRRVQTSNGLRGYVVEMSLGHCGVASTRFRMPNNCLRSIRK
jgi:hypothetical protein